MFPALEAEHPDAIRALRAEHEGFRSALGDLGLRVDLHTIREPAVRAFVDGLRAHAALEDATLYAWGDSTVPADIRRRLAERAAAHDLRPA